MQINVARYVVTDFVQNMRLLWVEQGADLIVVDPGGEIDRVVPVLDQLKPAHVHVFLTHAHLDHAGGVSALVEELARLGVGSTLYASQIEREIRESIPEHALLFGLSSRDYRACPEPQRYLEGGEVLNLLGVNWKVLFVPGHSPGHLAFYAAGNKDLTWNVCDEVRSRKMLKGMGGLIGGDVLFRESVGRVDLPGGSEVQLLHSIRQTLFDLPDDTLVFTGHGDDTTIGHERKHNPFVV